MPAPQKYVFEGAIQYFTGQRHRLLSVVCLPNLKAGAIWVSVLSPSGSKKVAAQEMCDACFELVFVKVCCIIPV